jgi:hypothetical protein
MRRREFLGLAGSAAVAVPLSARAATHAGDRISAFRHVGTERQASGRFQHGPARRGWRKAYPKLDKFNETMLERPLCKVSVPLKS